MIRKFLLPLLFAILSVFGTASAQSIDILTGGKAGVYYPVGQQLKQILEREIPGSVVTVRATQGTVENLNLLQRGTGHLALAQGDILSAAMDGNAAAGFPSSRTKIRLVGAAYPNYIHLVARRDSQIHSIRDLVGKRVSVGAARSGNELNARALLGAVGLSYADLLQVEYLHYGETVELLAKGELDAAVVSAGIGVSAVVDAMQRGQVILVPIDQQAVLANPRMFFATSIPAHTYPGQRNAVPTAALNNYFVTSAEVPESVVYKITKAIFTHLDELRAAHGALRTMSIENALRVRPIEVHPGALRHFKAVGALK